MTDFLRDNDQPCRNSRGTEIEPFKFPSVNSFQFLFLQFTFIPILQNWKLNCSWIDSFAESRHNGQTGFSHAEPLIACFIFLTNFVHFLFYTCRILFSCVNFYILMLRWNAEQFQVAFSDFYCNWHFWHLHFIYGSWLANYFDRSNPR